MNEKDLKLLTEVVNYGTLSDGVSEIINQMKKEKVKAIHTNKISQTDSRGRWQTYARIEGETRKKIIANTKSELYQKLYEFYYEDKIKTLSDLFPTFLNERKSEGLCEDTIRKDQNHYDKYYKDHSVMQKPTRELRSSDITKFIHEIIVEHQMSKKEIHKVKLIMKRLCMMALERDLTPRILFLPETFNLRACSPSNAELELPEDRYIPDGTRIILLDHLWSKFNNQPKYSPTLALLLAFQTGLRNGELSALEISNINFDRRELYIRKQESSTTKDTKTKLKTKNSYRVIALNDDAITIINKAILLANSRLNPSGYLFTNNKGERQTARSISACLERCCKHLNITQYSTHDIRRTFATNVYMNNPKKIAVLSKILGHATIQQTHEYIQDTVQIEDMQNLTSNIYQQDQSKDADYNDDNKVINIMKYIS